MQLTPTREQQTILDSFKEQLDFYQQVYTIQKAYCKHFHWTYSMFKTRFGVWIPDEIKKKKKVVLVQQSTIDFVNLHYKSWCTSNGVDFGGRRMSKDNKQAKQRGLVFGSPLFI